MKKPPPERCPTCGTHMDFRKPMQPEPRRSGGVQSPKRGVTARTAVDFSDVWDCPRHGQFRVYASGAVAPFA